MRSITSTVVVLWVITLAQNLFAKEVDQVDYPLKNWVLICDFLVKCVQTNHLGLDGKDSIQVVVAGTPVYAPAHGIVKEAQYHFGYGGTVIIEHSTDDESFTSVFGHLRVATLMVNPGQEVQRGDIIGYLGAKAENGGYAPHLHWGVKKGVYQSIVVQCASGKEWNYAGYPTCSTTFEDWYDPKVLVAMDFDPDADQDGYTIAQGDCDDNNSVINPDAQEVCDHQDNNCNSQTDEEWQIGLASDLGNSCTVGVGDCQNKGSMVCTADGLAAVCSVDALSAQAEICDNLDNDCDGLTDEDFKTGLAQDLGNPCTVGLGECQNQGQMVCAADGKATVCSVDALLPNCEGKECGDDGCEGICGECSEQATCQNSQCCQPNCQNKKCGYDGCGGSCGICLNWQYCDNGDCVSLELIDCNVCHEIADPCDPPFICVSTPKYNSYNCHIPCTTNADCPNFYCGIGSGGALGTKPSVCYTCPADF